MESFLSKLIDWKNFELFVADLYKDAESMVVEHNVTEKGKSGAKRQIDVRVYQKTKLHTLKIIIKCKRWKEPVTRSVIDVLVAAMDDLNANKGAIFTTTGYEEGAELYAKEKNIDLFIVRDLYEQEWAAPGRHIFFYIQYYGSAITDLHFQNSKVFMPPGKTTDQLRTNFNIVFSDKQEFPAYLDLYSLGPTQQKGANLVKLIVDTRNMLMKHLLDNSNVFLGPEDGQPEVRIQRKVILNFKDYPFKYFQQDGAIISFDNISYLLTISISQNKFNWDRAGNVDFALVVENYITSQRNFASKRKDEDKVSLSEPVVEHSEENDKDILKENGRVMKVLLEHYVVLLPRPDIVPQIWPDQIVNLQGPPNNESTSTNPQ